MSGPLQFKQVLFKGQMRSLIVFLSHFMIPQKKQTTKNKTKNYY